MRMRADRQKKTRRDGTGRGGTISQGSAFARKWAPQGGRRERRLSRSYKRRRSTPPRTYVPTYLNSFLTRPPTTNVITFETVLGRLCLLVHCLLPAPPRPLEHVLSPLFSPGLSSPRPPLERAPGVLHTLSPSPSSPAKRARGTGAPTLPSRSLAPALPLPLSTT